MAADSPLHAIYVLNVFYHAFSEKWAATKCYMYISPIF